MRSDYISAAGIFTFMLVLILPPTVLRSCNPSPTPTPPPAVVHKVAIAWEPATSQMPVPRIDILANDVGSLALLRLKPHLLDVQSVDVGYTIYRAPCLTMPTPLEGAIPGVGLCDSAGPLMQIGLTDEWMFVDTDVTAGDSYNYCVSSTVSGVESACSNSLAATIPAN